jgi:hypothetical protein
MKEASRLFEVVADLVEDETAKVSSDHLGMGRAFLEALRKGLPAKLRRDVAAVEEQFAATEGRTLAQVVRQLSRNGPGKQRKVARRAEP